MDLSRITEIATILPTIMISGIEVSKNLKKWWGKGKIFKDIIEDFENNNIPEDVKNEIKDLVKNVNIAKNTNENNSSSSVNNSGNSNASASIVNSRIEELNFLSKLWDELNQNKINLENFISEKIKILPETNNLKKIVISEFNRRKELILKTKNKFDWEKQFVSGSIVIKMMPEELKEKIWFEEIKNTFLIIEFNENELQLTQNEKDLCKLQINLFKKWNDSRNKYNDMTYLIKK